MKTLIEGKSAGNLLLCLVTLLIVPFQAAAEPGKECSIELAEIRFTRCLNDAEENAVTKDKAIILKSDAKKDFFNDPDGKLTNSSAPVLLTEVDNTQPFTFVTKVTPEFKESYDAGALYIYLTEKRWQKFAFEQDERGVTRIVSVRTIGTSDDNNHQPVDGDSVYLKISSGTQTVGFYFSDDKVKWNLARLYKNDYPDTIWLGVSSQSPVGDGNVSRFEDFSLIDESVDDFRMGI